MKAKTILAFLALALLAGVRQAAAQGTAFTYQGRLNSGTNAAGGNYNFEFSLFNALSGGSQIGSTVTSNNVVVINGLFTVTVDFGAGVFTGATNWLQIAVETNGAGSFTTLTPRQQVTSAPYAVYSESGGALSTGAALGAGSGNSISASGATDAFIGGGTANQILNSSLYAAIAGGQDNIIEANAGLAFIGGGQGNQTFSGWSVIGGGNGNIVGSGTLGGAIGGGYNNTNNGNYTTVAGGRANLAGGAGDFIGGGGYNGTVTVGNTVQANAATIGGGLGNSIPIGGTYAFIGGGAQNTNSGQYSTTGGGAANTNGGQWATIGGGEYNTNSGQYATISGGAANTAAAYGATVDGGLYNNAGGEGAFIGGGGYDGTFGGNSAQAAAAALGGGYDNTILTGGAYGFIGGGARNTNSGEYATIGGGQLNSVTGQWGTTPGGYSNLANGEASFAAGFRAQAYYNDSFVWSDGSAAGGVFSDSGPQQFLIQATGGVGIGTSAPQQSLSVNGGMNLDQANLNNGVVATNALTFGSGSGEGIASKRTSGSNQFDLEFYTGSSNRMTVLRDGAVNINPTDNGSLALVVNGTIQASNPTNGPALAIGAGTINVAGAGLNTSTAAFIQYVTFGNEFVDGGKYDATIIDNPLCNGDGSAMLLVTQNAVGSTANTVSVYVAYGSAPGAPAGAPSTNWLIFTSDGSAITVGNYYNVLVIKN